MKKGQQSKLALFLVAPSGIGKTRFIDEVATRRSCGPVIRIRSRRSSGYRYENAFILTRLSEALHEFAVATKEIHTIKQFNGNVREYLTVDEGVDVAGDVLEELKVPVLDQIKKVVERQLSVGRFRPARLLNPNETGGIAYLKLYVRSVIARHALTLSFENAHLMDEASLEFLVEDLDWRSGSRLILEFTNVGATRSRQTWSIGELADDFERAGFATNIMTLMPLEFDHYREAAVERGMGDDHALREVYRREGGNIRAIYDLAVLRDMRREPPPTDKSSAIAAIAALPADERFLTIALSVHGDAIPEDRFTVFLGLADERVPSIRSHKSALEALIEREFAERGSGSIQLAHDTIATATDDKKHQSLRTLAAELWASIYESEEALRADEWQRLLSLHAEIQDPRRFALAIERALPLLASTQYKDDLIPAFAAASSLFADRIRHESRTFDLRAISSLIDVWFELEEFERASDLLPLLPAHPLRSQMLKAALLDRLDRAEEAISFAQDAGAIIGENKKERLPFVLVEIASLASLNRRPEARRRFDSALEIPDLANAYEYPYLLRIADITHPIPESIPLIELSAELFAKRNDAREQGHSLNALGMQRARLGDVEQAMIDLEEASTLLTNASAEYALTLNNIAATTIWLGAPTSFTAIQLQMARDLVKRPFDKIVVALNEALLAMLPGSSDPIKAMARVEGLLLNANLPDRTLWRTFYWNRHFFLQRAGEKKKANEDLEKIRSLNLLHRDIWAHRLNDEPVDDWFRFQLQRGYVAPYLSKWHFSVDPRHPNGL